MSLLYEMIFEIKTDLQDHEQIRVEINENMGSIICKDDRISCVDNTLVIIRGGYECLIPLNHVLRVKREKRVKV